MKKIFAVGIAAVLLAAFCACTGPTVETSTVSSQAQQAESTVPDAPATSLSPSSTSLSSPAGQLPAVEDAPAPDGTDAAWLERQAEILAEHLVRSTGLIREQPQHRDIAVFVMGLVWYSEDTEYMYGGLTGQTEKRLYTFPEENIRRVAWEVFAAPDWGFGQMEGGQVTYNEAQGQYESGLEFGFASSLGVESTQVQSSADGREITVTADLCSLMVPEAEQGSCVLTFLVVEEEDRAFLRFKDLQYLE